MTSWAYYNEIDPFAAEWIKNLILAGHVAPGEVDTRSIEDVRPEDLHGFTQCHFFAGIAVWSYALRKAGWPDERPIWTGSCPCQPFSAAGQGAAFDDERHLWPAFQHLIRERRPASLAGEQVASKDADPWLDLVQTDLEALGYAFGAVAFPSAGVGAPHIRDRTYWMAHAEELRWQGKHVRPGGRVPAFRTENISGAGGLADADGRDTGTERQQRGGEQRQQSQDSGRGGMAPGGLADNQGGGRRKECSDIGRFAVGDRTQGGAAGFGDDSGDLRPGPTNGHWRDADWLFCRDGKWRPVEPGTFPLAHGATSRVGRLRAYGNAINAEAARVFIEVMMECMPC